uniref:Uncharacterized protein n=1 Tax=viral metagenome TaxID=1070528 RepID=A0A6M3LSV3_9ZZZZ
MRIIKNMKKSIKGFIKREQKKFMQRVGFVHKFKFTWDTYQISLLLWSIQHPDNLKILKQNHKRIEKDE